MMPMKLLRPQKSSRRVIMALMPCVAGGMYFFGWRSLAMVLVACAVGYAAEWLFCRYRKEPVTEAAFVTAVLFAVIMPPTVGWHVVVIGMVVSIVFAKEVFGGFGRNIFNPAMAGRCFVYICFATAVTATWAPNAYDLPDTPWYGALGRWSTLNVTAAEAEALAASNRVEAERAPEIEARWKLRTQGDSIQAFTGASPLGELKSKQREVIRLTVGGAESEKIDRAATVVEDDRPGIGELLLGTTSGTMGVTSAVLILIGGVYLYITKTANRATILSVIISCAVFSEILYLFGVRPSGDWLSTTLSGGFLLGAFFMATDPVSSAKTQTGRIICGVIVGVLRVVIQNFSVFNGGFMFGLLVANMFAPSIDAMVKARQAARKAKAAEA